MSYNPQPDPQNVVVISAGSSVTEVNRFPVGIGTTGIVSVANSVTVNQGTSPWVVSASGGSLPVAFPDATVTEIGRAHV